VQRGAVFSGCFAPLRTGVHPKDAFIRGVRWMMGVGNHPFTSASDTPRAPGSLPPDDAQSDDRAGDRPAARSERRVAHRYHSAVHPPTLEMARRRLPASHPGSCDPQHLCANKCSLSRSVEKYAIMERRRMLAVFVEKGGSLISCTHPFFFQMGGPVGSNSRIAAQCKEEYTSSVLHR